MTSKQIIDTHFEKNYKYYRQVCYRYYRGKYLYEDLLNESYLEFLKVKEPVIFKFSNRDKLHCIGLKIIRSLYQKRFSKANRNKGNGCNSSQLFETPSISYEIEFTEQEGKDETEIQMYFERATIAIEKALTYPVSEGKDKTPYQLVQAFLAVEASSVNKISKETGISRTFITETYKQGKEYLKQEVLK